MDDVKACRICLEMDVTLHSLHSNSLERYYEIITGTNPLVKSLLPMYACYECAAMLKKFFMFRQKSLRGQVILQGILQICGKINEVDIKEIDRRSFHLNSSLTTVNLPYIDAEPEINDDLIKQEPCEADNIEDIVRKAFDNDCLSDDETLSMLKSLNYEKIKEEEAIPALEEIKEEKSEEPCETDNVEDIVSERLDNDCLSNDEPLSIHKIRKYEKSMEEEVAILMLEKEPGKADNVEDIVSKCLDNDRLSDDAPLSTHKRRKYEKSKEEEVAILTLEKEPREADNNEDIVSEYLDNDRLSDDAPLSMHKRRKYEKSKGEEVAIPALEKSKDKADNIERLDNDKLSDDAPLSMHKRRKYEKSKEEEVAILAKKSKNPEEVEVRGTLKSVMNFPYGCIDTLNFKSFVTIITLTEDEQREEIRKRQESENYKNSNLKCELCFKGFLDTQTWQHHAKKHDETSGSEECEICKLRFKTRRILNKHVVGHAKKYMCKYCPYVSRHVSQAKQHLFWHQGVTYKCPYCDEMLSKWTSYLSHVRLKHPSDFICGFCGYSFVSKLGLSMHKTMMHKDLPEPGGARAPYCAPCDVRFASDEAHGRHLVTARRHTQTAENKNGCRECGEAFSTAEELRAHTRLAHGRKWARSSKKSTDNRTWPVTCPHCSEEIANARLYWAHFRRYHPDKDYPIIRGYVCEVCGKRFRSNAFLMYHKRTHGTEKTFKCKECGKSFYNRGNLLLHEKTHSEQRPYMCCECGKGFKFSGSLDRHFRCHTGEKPYKCEECGKAFGQSNSCKLHVRTVHLKQPSPYVSRSRLDKRNKNATAERQSSLLYITE